MENDAEFEDEDGGELGSVFIGDETVVLVVVGFVLAAGIMLALVTEVIVAANAGVASGGFNVVAFALFHTVVATNLGLRDGCMSVAGVVLVTAAKVAVAHRHELEEEHEKDGHKGDAFWPRVFGDDTSQAFVA